MKNGPDFENRLVKTLLRQGEADRVPLVEIGIHKDVKKAFLGGQKKGLDGEVRFWVDAGYDFIPISTGLATATVPALLRQVESEEAERVQIATRKTTSDYSKFSSEDTQRTWIEEGRGTISTMSDFESYNWPTPDDNDYALIDKVGECLPENMKIIANMGDVITPLYSLTGFETFYTSVYEDPELLASMFDRVGSIQYEIFKRIIQHKQVGAAWIGDDIAYSEHLMVSPKVLRQYLFPWYKKMGALCKEADKPFIFHSDGKLYDVIDDLVDCGFCTLHPIEPKAMDINYVKKTWGDRLCIIGNIDLAYTLTLGTPQEVDEEVKQRIHDLAPGGGYCVSSSNSITEYVPLENYKAMREAVLKYGTYPISV